MEQLNLNEINDIKKFFKDIRFYMGNSVLEGMLGKAYVDSRKETNIAILSLINKYCFISGDINEDKLKEIIDENFINYTLIPSDNISEKIEKIYKGKLIKSQRYSIKKNPKFDIIKLKNYISQINSKYEILKIDETLADRIKQENFITITEDYAKYGVGFCCLYEDKIIGVASSNIIYKDGIEVNIKVQENFRKQGISTALAASLILECINIGKKVSWDAANKISVRLAEKLGFEYDSAYNVYNLVK